MRNRSLWIWSGVVVPALVLWGGYSGRMSWTAINGQTATPWDWLHLLLLPLLPPTIIVASAQAVADEARPSGP